DAIEIDEMQQQMRKALCDRARSQHLGQRRIALALESEPFDQADRKVRDLYGKGSQLLSGQMHHAAIAGCNAGPLMHAALEHFRPADEIADVPIGQRDLAAERGGVEHPDTAALDQPDAVMLAALAEQRLAAVEHFSAALLQH